MKTLGFGIVVVALIVVGGCSTQTPYPATSNVGTGATAQTQPREPNSATEFGKGGGSGGGSGY